MGYPADFFLVMRRQFDLRRGKTRYYVDEYDGAGRFVETHRPDCEVYDLTEDWKREAYKLKRSLTAKFKRAGRGQCVLVARESRS